MYTCHFTSVLGFYFGQELFNCILFFIISFGLLFMYLVSPHLFLSNKTSNDDCVNQYD